MKTRIFTGILWESSGNFEKSFFGLKFKKINFFLFPGMDFFLISSKNWYLSGCLYTEILKKSNNFKFKMIIKTFFFKFSKNEFSKNFSNKNFLK